MIILQWHISSAYMYTQEDSITHLILQWWYYDDMWLQWYTWVASGSGHGPDLAARVWGKWTALYTCICMYVHIYIYIYIYVHVYVYVYIYIHIRERERERWWSIWGNY